MATLIYHTGALGDFITTLPALRYLRERGDSLTLFGKPEFVALAIESGVIDAGIDLDDRAWLPLFHDRFSPEAGALLSGFSTAVIFSADDSPMVRNVRASEIKTVYTQEPFPDRDLHVVDHHLSLFIDPTTLAANDRIPRVTVSPGAIRTSEQIVSFDRPFITIHPGSGSPRKNWPIERFREVSDRLRQQGNVIVWLGGAAETGLNVKAPDQYVKNLPLPDIAALLHRSRLYLGNDSGITHLAAAVGCPVVALFGPSDPVVWAPRGERVTVIDHKTHCAPCHRASAGEPTCRRECITETSIDEVMEAIHTLVPSCFNH
ncbi:MAG: glycosyltransferase family 9 protein [Chitinispirillaceae bacterium]|nr:glycosyltransferase family 9 protein [Chitinispirillaceae bacterium]